MMRTPLLAIVFVAGCGISPDDELDFETAESAVTSCPANTWCTEPAPAGTGLLYSVHAVDDDVAFAVGDNGKIIHRAGGVWAAATSGTTKHLRGVWAASATDAWAVGLNGAVLRWNGTSWSQHPSAPVRDYGGVWGAAANDVWLIAGSSALRWDGSTWTTKNLTGGLLDISGASATSVWITGEQAYVRRYSGGTTWTTLQPGAGVSYRAIEARTPTDVWVSAPTAGTRRFNGSTWTTHTTGSYIFNSIHAPAASLAWGAATSGRVGQWNGTAWTVSQVPGVSSTLWDVHGAAGHVYVVGSNGTILHRY